jgi:type II secretory ATPase GspE/PulE/Tfp pilus assembly ATPase PilB-like protein
MSLPELLHVTPTVSQHILNMSDAAAIMESARKDNFKTMREWGTDAVNDGITTIQEVERATG